MLLRGATILAMTLAAYGGAVAPPAAAAGAQDRDAGAWTIGPIIRGRNYSRGMPLHPTALRGGGFAIDLPQAPGSVHYVTFRHGSLAGKRRIVMRYRIEADPGVRIVPRTNPAQASMLTPFFQRSGDNWTARGPYESYRWYATFATHSPIRPGTFEMVVPLNGNWTAVETSSARTNPEGFRDAVANADQVGFVLGGGDGYGHGVYATGRARLVVTEFRVE
jgi:hypothetical protein